MTDFDQARQLLNDNCGAGQPGCTYDASKQQVIAAPRSQWRMYGNPQSNCDSPDVPDVHEYGQKQTISWKETFSAKGGVKFDIELVEAEVEGKYEDSITEAHDFQEKHTQNIPYLKTVAFFLQPGVLNIVGDFLIGQEDKVYSIKNFAFDIPLSGNFQPDVGPPIPQVLVLGLAWDANCPPHRTPLKLRRGDPPPPDAVVIERFDDTAVAGPKRRRR